MRGDSDQLDEFLEDVLATEACDPELVLRHQADPGSLSAEERAEVEAWLATPAGRDALAAMRALHSSGTLLAPHASGASREPGETEHRRSAAPAHRARGFLRERRALAAALAAAIVAALLFWRAGPFEGGGGAPEGERIARELPAPPVAPQPESPQAAPAPRAPARPEPPPEEASAPPAVPETPPPAPVAPEPSPRVPEPGPKAPPGSQPVLLAMAMPNYARPEGASYGHLDAALRGSGSGTRPFALSPDHVGRTSRAQPTLYWHLSALPAEGAQVWLAIADESKAESLLELELPRPERSGWQAIPLSGRASLTPGVDYTWSIALRTDPDDPASDAIAFGWIRFEPLAAEDAAAIARATPGEKPAAFAARGRFYDALDELVALEAQHAGDPRIDAARDALLEQAGIDPARTR
jgi:hypothetical protein